MRTEAPNTPPPHLAKNDNRIEIPKKTEENAMSTDALEQPRKKTYEGHQNKQEEQTI